ncbi:MAG: cytochrome P460 family protein [Proteobacteria bacterium]|nr:cytochrome P460 family protein [Pseudomonadota bacterium]
MKNLAMIVCLSLSGSLAVSCGHSKDKETEAVAAGTSSSQDALSQKPGMFPENLLSEFKTWTPVLKGDQAFKSAGHGGILVRGYLNEIATNHVKTSDNPFPLPVGTVIAKAVVESMSADVNTANRVYFMKKEAPGFDTEHNDWSYAVAERVADKLSYDKTLDPKAELCVSCHVKFAAFDYVKTVQFYKQDSENR